jgi:hypothetical protein
MIRACRVSFFLSRLLFRAKQTRCLDIDFSLGRRGGCIVLFSCSFLMRMIPSGDIARFGCLFYYCCQPCVCYFNAGRDVAVSCQPFLVATQTGAEISDDVIACIPSVLPNTVQRMPKSR